MPGDELARLRRLADGRLAEYAHARRTVRDERAALAAAKQALEDALGARAIVQETAARVQAGASGQIAAVVTRALQAVFGEGSYEFQIRFVARRGKTEADLVFVDVATGREIDPRAAASGGVVDVAAYALRLAKLLLARPAVSPVLIMDEPFRFVGRTNAPRVRGLLETLSAELGVQHVIVTHDRRLAADRGDDGAAVIDLDG